MKKQQKYVPVSSCRVYDETSEICANMYLYSTLRRSRNMCQYLVVEYTLKHQKYVLVDSCRVHDETSEICASI